MGYLPQGMVNYLALLGWGDGTENEFFSLDQLGSSFCFSLVVSIFELLIACAVGSQFILFPFQVIYHFTYS